MDVLFTGNTQNGYLALALESAESGAEIMQKVQDELESHRIPVTRPHALIACTEQYWSSTRNWVIEVLLDFRNQRLKMKLQARDDEEYCLRHYHNDIFVWSMSYDNAVKRAQYCRPADYYKVGFRAREHESSDSFTHLRRRHDPSVPEGELFDREKQE